MKNNVLTCICIIISICFFTTEGFSQRVLPTTVSAPTNWEIGADLLWLINKNVLPKYALLIRRNIGKYGALRFRGGINYVGTATTKYDDRESKEYQVRIGYEYRSTLKTNKIYIYYGLELLYAYDYEFFNDYNHLITVNSISGTPTASTLFTTKEIEKGANFFVGYKYIFNRNFSVSSESSFQLTDWKKDVVQFNVDSFKYRNTNYQVFPFSSLNFSYHF